MYHLVRVTRASNLWLPLRGLARCADKSIIISAGAQTTEEVSVECLVLTEDRTAWPGFYDRCQIHRHVLWSRSPYWQRNESPPRRQMGSFPQGLSHVCAGLAVTLKKDQCADQNGHPGDSPLSRDLNTNNVFMSQRAGERAKGRSVWADLKKNTIVIRRNQVPPLQRIQIYVCILGVPGTCSGIVFSSLPFVIQLYTYFLRAYHASCTHQALGMCMCT